MGSEEVSIDIEAIVNALDEIEINMRDAYHAQPNEWKNSEPGRRVLKGLHELRCTVLTLQYPEEPQLTSSI